MIELSSGLTLTFCLDDHRTSILVLLISSVWNVLTPNPQYIPKYFATAHSACAASMWKPQSSPDCFSGNLGDLFLKDASAFLRIPIYPATRTSLAFRLTSTDSIGQKGDPLLCDYGSGESDNQHNNHRCRRNTQFFH